MTCEDYRERLSTYIDQELAASELTQVESHLAECLGCSAELERLKELTTQLREEPGLEMPVDAAARLDEVVSAALRERRAVSVPSSTDLPATEPWWKRLLHPAFGGLAASMAVLVFAVIVWSGAQDDGGPGGPLESLRDSASSESKLKMAAPNAEEAKPKRSFDDEALTAPQTLGKDDSVSPATFTQDDLVFLSRPDLSKGERAEFGPVDVEAGAGSREMMDTLRRRDVISAPAVARIVADDEEAELLFAELGLFKDSTGVREAWIVVIELKGAPGAPVAAAVSLDGQVLYRTD